MWMDVFNFYVGGFPPEFIVPPTNLKNQFPTHFLFIVNLTILYKNKIPFQEKKMKSIDKSSRAVLQNGHYPEITYIVDFILLNYSDLWNNRFSIKNPFQEKKMKSIDKCPRVNSPGPTLPGGNPPTH